MNIHLKNYKISSIGSLQKIMEHPDEDDEDLKIMADIYHKNLSDREKRLRFKQILKDSAAKFIQLDDTSLELREHMKIHHKDQIIEQEDMPQMLKHVPDGSLIIYLQKGKCCTIYDNYEDFERDMGTHFYRPELYGLAYEVVRDEHSQRINITVSDMMNDEQIASFKKDILTFIKTFPEYVTTKIKDLKAYSDNNATEVIVGNIILKNIHEQDKFVERFTMFLDKIGKNELALKIHKHPEVAINDAYTDSRFHKLPSNKVSRDGNTDVRNGLITFTKNVVVNNYTILNNSALNSANVSINSNNKITATRDRKTLKGYFRSLYDNKPDWYIDDEWVDISIIADSYDEYFGEETNRSKISKQLTGVLYGNKDKRLGNVRKKKLIPHSELPSLFQ